MLPPMKSGMDTASRQPLLTVIEGPEKGQRMPVSGEALRIGRDPSCQLRLTDPQVSRIHAAVLHTRGGYELADLDSRNGTRLNGKAVVRHRLQDGDRIGVGDTSLRFNAHVQRVPLPVEERSIEDTQTLLLDARELAAGWAPTPPKDRKTFERAKADLEVLYRVGRMVSATLDIDALLKQLLDLLFEALDKIERCSIHLVDQASGELACREFRSLRPGNRQDAHTFSQSIVEQVLKERKAVLFIDERPEGRFEPGDSVTHLNIRSAICAPLVAQDQIIGLLNADTSKRDQRLDQQDLRLLASVGFQAGAAIENARLYASLQQEKQALLAAHHELQQTQAQLIQNEKMAAIGQLASGVVHDLKTPMMVIVGYADMLRRKLTKLSLDAPVQEQLEEYLDFIAQGVTHSDDVVKNLLHFARPSEPERVRTDLNQLVDDTITFVQPELRRGGIKVTVDHEDDLPEVEIDPVQIKQVFINIIINAVQAMERRGLLHVLTAIEERDGQAGIVTRFTDTGPGMSPEQLEQVFAPFYTTKQSEVDGVDEGTGLGLSVSYRIIHSHGGHLEAESTPGEGSAFTIWLPA